MSERLTTHRGRAWARGPPFRSSSIQHQGHSHSIGINAQEGMYHDDI
jgi:hypothetical protein